MSLFDREDSVMLPTPPVLNTMIGEEIGVNDLIFKLGLKTGLDPEKKEMVQNIMQQHKG